MGKDREIEKYFLHKETSFLLRSSMILRIVCEKFHAANWQIMELERKGRN
jgi:hypothetical protein